MAREAESGVPLDEALYRSVSVEDVSGDDVLPQAVDMPRCSFNRARYSEPEDVLTANRPADNGIVTVKGEWLPGPVPRQPGGEGKPYEFFVADDPTPDNDAHCEVRIRPQEGAFSKNHKVNKVVRAKAKDELARRLRILRPPTPPKT